MNSLRDILIGIDRESFQSIREEITSSNRLSLLFFSSITFFITALLATLSLIFPSDFASPYIYLYAACASAIIIVATLITKKTNATTTTLLCIVFLLVILTFGMLIGSTGGPNSSASIFITLLIAVPLLFTLRPFIVNTILVTMAIAYVIIESQLKSPETFQNDLINIAAITIISISIGLFTVDTRFRKLLAEKKTHDLTETIKRESLTDSLTSLLNRNSYEINFNKYPVVPKGRDFVYVSIDLNGLKGANDSKGHAAGDELIKGAADCMREAFTGCGNLYRIGGDEFVAILFVDTAKYATLKNDFVRIVDNWQGELCDSLSVAIGEASIADYPDHNVVELSKVADKLMYDDKNRYYSSGNKRKGRQEASTVLSSLYTKILKIDIGNDCYQIINMNDDEKTEEKGFSDKISTWLKEFALSGQVHPDDIDDYLKQTDLDYIRDFFKTNAKLISIKYRRKIDDRYKHVMMEIVPIDTYSDINQVLFLYVKDIED